MSRIDHVFAKSDATVALPGGGQAVIRKGQHWAASDPVVVDHPDLFTDDARFGMRYTRRPEGWDADRAEPVVESATAAPGEQRATRRRP